MYPQIKFPVSPFLKKSILFPVVNYSPSFCKNPSGKEWNFTPKDNSASSAIQISSLNPNSNLSQTSHSLSNCHSKSLLELVSVCKYSFIWRYFTLVLMVTAMLYFSFSANGQTTFANLQILKVNPLITTVITANEPIEIVDMSTDNIIGEKALDNTLMIKPINNEFKDGEFIATLTIITERYRVQYGLIYTEDPTQAVSDKQLFVQEMTSFKNPEIKMSKEEMRFYATRIWFSPSRIRNISSTEHRMKIRLNNLYSVGGYFFLDFSIENKTNIEFDIDEIRLKLSDKKIAKAANNQIIEICPEMILVPDRHLKKSYRNVLVIPKLTFPNEKVLTLEISEKQISGRTLKLNIDYEDVLNADAFSSDLIPQR